MCIILHNYSITANICIIEYPLHKIAYLVKQFKKTTYFGTKNDLFRYKKRLIWVQKTTYFGTKNDLFRYKKRPISVQKRCHMTTAISSRLAIVTTARSICSLFMFYLPFDYILIMNKFVVKAFKC